MTLRAARLRDEGDACTHESITVCRESMNKSRSRAYLHGAWDMAKPCVVRVAETKDGKVDAGQTTRRLGTSPVSTRTPVPRVWSKPPACECPLAQLVWLVRL